MTIAFDQDKSRRPSAEKSAANDDHMSYTAAYPRVNQLAQSSETTGGWDAYDVWRRLIKEARDRRSGRAFPG